MKTKIIFLKGLPYSGKTAYAEKVISESDSAVRVSKQDLFTMFGKGNDHVKDMFGSRALYALLASLQGRVEKVIVDDCNLFLSEGSKKVITSSINREVPEFSMRNQFSVSIKEMKKDVFKCIDEALKTVDGKRNVQDVPYIVNTALEFGLYPKPEKPFLLVELGPKVIETGLIDKKDIHRINGLAKEGHDIIIASDLPQQLRQSVDELLVVNNMFSVGNIASTIMEWSPLVDKKLFKNDKTWRKIMKIGKKDGSSTSRN